MAHEAERQVVLSHQRLVRIVRERITAYAQAQWTGLGSWRDADIDRFVARVVPAVESGQRQVANLTTSYLDSLARLAGISPRPPTQLATDLRGVPLSEVYRRPAVAVYTALSEGKPLDEGVRLGGLRLEQLIAMDMQMANVRASADRVSGDSRVIGYQRVLSPGENCALCAIASTQRYHREDLMPIHDH